MDCIKKIYKGENNSKYLRCAKKVTSPVDVGASACAYSLLLLYSYYFIIGWYINCLKKLNKGKNRNIVV